MYSESELLKAIEELEKATPTYQNAEKLATFYVIYDHLYGVNKNEPAVETVIDRYNGSFLYQVISGRNAKEVWRIINDMMKTVKAIQPKLYEETIRKIGMI